MKIQYFKLSKKDKLILDRHEKFRKEIIIEVSKICGLPNEWAEGQKRYDERWKRKRKKEAEDDIIKHAKR